MRKFCVSYILFLHVVLYAIVGPCAYAQGNIVIPHPQPKAKPKPAISIKLATEKAGKRVYFTTLEWSRLSYEERMTVNKIGLLICQGKEKFLLSLFDNMCGAIQSQRVSFQEANNKTGGQLPTKAQMQIIKNNYSRINEALSVFGGWHIASSLYWCKDGTYFDIWDYQGKSNGYSAKFRIATSDIEMGFRNPIVPNVDNGHYDYIGMELSEWEKQNDYLQLVGFGGKFGYINSEGETIVPLQYDYIDGRQLAEYNKNYSGTWNGKYLMSVCNNSKWGFINRFGDIVIPMEYDAVENRCNPVSAVKKEGLIGIINDKGDYLLPLHYSDIERNYYEKDLFFAEINGQFGFFDSNYELKIPFKYDYVTGFNQDIVYGVHEDEDLCAVGINGKYGYIDRDGNEVIPLAYDFADLFYNGIAPIVKDNRLGFINTKGEVIISPQYYVDLINMSQTSYDSFIVNSRKTIKDSYSFCSFKISPYIAIVPTSSYGSFVVINNTGTVISQHEYKKVSETTSRGFIVELAGGEKIYLDLVGREYKSEEARDSNHNNTIECLANLGFVDYMLLCWAHYHLEDDDTTANEWLLKAATKGSAKAMSILGNYYYQKSQYNLSYDWYLKALQNGDIYAQEKLGDLFYYEKGLDHSYSKASDWYSFFLAEQTIKEKSKAEVYEKMGRIYYYGGYGIERSYSKAFEYFSKSSTNASMYYLGWMYEHYQGTYQDIDKSIEFYQKSNGYSDAKERISKLQSQ